MFYCAKSLFLILTLEVLPPERRRKFKYELSKEVNKNYLHEEVLAHQQVLDFDSYKSIMSLINAFVTEITDQRNEAEFEQRMELLKQQQDPEAKKKYEQLVRELINYQLNVQANLLKLAQDSLEIKEPIIMMNSHDTYADRKMLFDHMNEVIDKRGDRNLKRAVTKKLNMPKESQKLNEAYEFYSDQLSQAHQRMQEQPELSNPERHGNYIDEQSLMLED